MRGAGVAGGEKGEGGVEGGVGEGCGGCEKRGGGLVGLEYWRGKGVEGVKGVVERVMVRERVGKVRKRRKDGEGLIEGLCV